MTKSLILASGSAARKSMMQGAGLDFKAIPADIDEGVILREPGLSPQEKASALAKAKARHVAIAHPETLVIGSDQVLTLGEQIFSKAPSRDEALEKLKTLNGKTHHLISAVAVMQGEQVLWSTSDTVVLTMHRFDDAFLENYLDKAGDAATSCVGAYALEAHGSWLFEKVEGDFFTVLGMPLLPLLSFLRTKGFAP